MQQTPDGMRAAHLVVDAATGKVLQTRHEDHKIRAASLVKPLIAVDHLLRLDGPVPDADRVLLEPMLQASDDDAASELWDRGGRNDVVGRMVAEMGLADTAPPRDPEMWGYTAITAADIVRMYDYLRCSHRIGNYVLANLGAYTKFAADGFKQSFGLPSGADHPVAVKQGWSGFGPGPNESVNGKSRRKVPDERIDLQRPAMHSTGTVRHGDRERIMVVLTLQPEATSWDTSAARITELTRELDAAAAKTLE